MVERASVGRLVRFVENMETPVQFSLCQNYPNPFNPATTIEFTVPEAGYLKLIIYNIMGQKVKTLVSEYVTPGVHSVVWDGRDENGTPVSSGVHISHLMMGRKTATMKVMFQK